MLAHCDFFKNNARFGDTNRNMVESMSATADRIHQYEMDHGTEAVEKFIDAILAIQEHVDPTLIKPYQLDKKRYIEMVQKDSERSEWKIPTSSYDDLWNLDPDRTAAAASAAQSQAADAKRFPPRPEKVVIWFIEEYSPTLQDWQRDILSMLRDELLFQEMHLNR
ncbi:hypothetical protein BK120_12025 [Paenibacillus sp. FSL A5-0031]|nr:hypothetical protein BK120_12025 [Paenibacillus sp. FSL A5-0031]